MSIKTSATQTDDGFYALRNISTNWIKLFQQYYPSGFSEKDLEDSRLTPKYIELIPYFGCLQQILHQIEVSQLTPDEKEEYYSPGEQSCTFLRALFSDDDLSRKIILLDMLPEDIPFCLNLRFRENAWRILHNRHVKTQ